MTTASEHAWFNGNITPREAAAPSVASISFHLGTGVFDGMVAYWNHDRYYIHRGEQHLVRFKEGAARMGLTIPWTVAELMSGIQSLLAHEPQGTQYVRPIAYRAAPELWITGSEGKPVDVAIFTVKMQRDIDTPMTCHLSTVERISSRAVPRQTKVSGAYVNSFNARKAAELAGFQDGLMLDREGRITEASAANFFAIAGDRLLTPPLNVDVFPGITREVVLEVAADVGIDCQVSDLHPQDLRRIDGAFLCSTLLEIRPLSRLDDSPLATSESRVYRSIVRSFRKLTHQQRC
jgi:branched-chain amino acid aminotransferase